MSGKKPKVIFITVEAILYAGFMLLDIRGGYGRLSDAMKYASIILCAAFSLVRAITIRCVFVRTTGLAFSFTAWADFYLLFTTQYMQGIILFVIVQIQYLVILIMAERYRRTDDVARRVWIHLGAAIAASVAGGFAGWVSGLIDPFMAGIVAFYGFSFIRNIVLAVRLRIRAVRDGAGPDRTGLRTGLFTAGLIVFFLCDVNVLLYNLPDYIDVNSGILLFLLRFAGDFMWMFYLPGQCMLCLSPYEIEPVGAAPTAER